MDVSELSAAFRLYAGKERTDTVNTRSGKAFTLYSLPYYLAGRIEAFLEAIDPPRPPSRRQRKER